MSEELGAVRVSKGVGTAISGYDKEALADGARLWQGWVAHLVALRLHLRAAWEAGWSVDSAAKGGPGAPGVHTQC